jgi:hypothetical protein
VLVDSRKRPLFLNQGDVSSAIAKFGLSVAIIHDFQVGEIIPLVSGVSGLIYVFFLLTLYSLWRSLRRVSLNTF